MFVSSAAARPDKSHVRKATTTSTIVLVHGAWADGSSWNNVYQLLRSWGFKVVIPPNPLQGLASDSADVADYLHKGVSGPIVLVGHSYGGAVITNAAVGDPNVKALVYVDAYIPKQGQTLLELTSAQPGSCLGGEPADAFNFVPFVGAPAGDFDTYMKQAADGSLPRVCELLRQHPSVLEGGSAVGRATAARAQRAARTFRTAGLDEHPLLGCDRDRRPPDPAC